MSEYYWVPDGCIPDLPDFRDWIYKPNIETFVPPIVDLRNLSSVIEDQGSIGSCTANAIVGAIEMLINKLGKPYEDLSRLFIYYNTRTLQGTLSNGDITYGTSIREAIKTCVDIGVCTEEIWPYANMLWNILPSVNAYTDALRHRVTNYYSIMNHEHIRYAVAEGYGVVFGIQIYDSFQNTPSSGIVPENDIALSGHAMVIVGYNDQEQKYIVRNSWGTDWGNNGYCFMDYNYVNSEGYNFWIIKQYHGILAEDPEPDPDEIPLMIVPQPPSGGYISEQLLTFFVNKIGEIRISLNGGQFFTYNSPIPIVANTDIVYYFKEETKFSDKFYLTYTIDHNPMVVTPVTPPGTYRSVVLHFNSNIPGDIFIIQPNDLQLKYDSNNPIAINQSRNVTFFGVSANGIVYPSKTILYVIDSNIEPIVRINNVPGKYFKPISLELSSYELGKIMYYLGSSPGSELEYTSPIAITATDSIFYRHEYSASYIEAEYIIAVSGMLYRVNGGEWLEYVEPILVDRFSVVEAMAIFEDGSYSDINSIAYTVYNADQYWVVVG